MDCDDQQEIGVCSITRMVIGERVLNTADWELDFKYFDHSKSLFAAINNVLTR